MNSVVRIGKKEIIVLNILNANKDVFNLPVINLTAIGTALPSKYIKYVTDLFPYLFYYTCIWYKFGRI